jgi:cobalt-zinc-cadmium efflux system outer membrane protein
MKIFINIKYAALLLLGVGLCSFPLKAQHILSYTDYLEAVKSNNLQYMAEQYNIKIADAEVTAQKVFPDPELAFDAS